MLEEEEEEGSLVEGVQEGSLVGLEEELQGKGEEEEFKDHQLAGQKLLLQLKTDHQLKERIANMTQEGKDNLLAQICQKHPNMVFEVVNCSSTKQQGYHPRPGGESPSWCICSNCREMPTDEEKQCCKQIPPNCYSRLPDFDLVVLDEVVLLVAQRYRQDVLAAEEDNDYNRGKRHAAYRQFILWTYGYLGSGNRRVIPSCCVWRIRDKYPDSFGQYRGFTQGRLG